MKLISKVEVYIEGKSYVVEEFILKKMYCLPFIKKMNSHRGYMDNIYDYGEDVVCCISDKKWNGKNYEFINLISLNLDENNTKRNRISTKIYTDIYHEKIN